MNLPEGFSVFGKRNARQLAVLRAENALMRMHVPADIVAVPEQLKPPTPVNTVCEAVRRVVNGTPLFKGEIVEIVRREYPELKASYCAVDAGLRRLVKEDQMQRIGTRQKFRFTQAVGALLLIVLVGCSTPQFNNVTTAPSQKINWYADVDWPRSESSSVKIYFVSYGLHPNTMTNELVTAANHCRIYGLELGRTYYFSVRASDGKSYSVRTPIVAFKTP